ncbi:MAG: hypothetical protein JWM16_1933 [Verrucomicrobiales bacterium]|nr:hypothetical protein [Verrucomicrobiales bacterium]
MKTLISSVAALAMLALVGCSTTRTVSQMQGHGDKVVYNAPFDATWRATVDAAQMSNLQVVDANRDTGYIAAKRGVRLETFGENVGIWVTREGPNQSGVEVVSRQAGPPVLWLKNWEKQIQTAVAANLTREAPYAVGTAGPGVGTVTGGASSVPMAPAPVYNTAPPTTVVVPPPVYSAPPANLATPNTTTTLRQDTEAQIRSLQQQQLAREQELQREQDAKRRASLQDDIDILKNDLQKMQQRLSDLEREQRTLPNQ